MRAMWLMAKISETFAPEALTLVTDWIVERARKLTAPAAPRPRRGTG